MRIAFYAPLKPPDHPTPSGDRQIARLLMRALGEAGHDVEVASRLRSRDADGDPELQKRLRDMGAAEAEGLTSAYRDRAAGERPDLWFTYHLYYKAADWIGPGVAAQLRIPYVVAEASVAPKRAEGPWALAHAAVLSALGQAALVVTLNPADAECLPDPGKSRPLRPFLDATPYREAGAARATHRKALADTLAIPATDPWLLAVAMMRRGDKRASYGVLAQALTALSARSWRLIVVGDGDAREEVAADFAPLPRERLRFLGELRPDELPPLYAASDLMVWPAINEAYGMTLLEAQATGLPVVAGRAAGVAAIVRDRETGLLTAPGSWSEFAGALERLLDDPPRRRRFAESAAAIVQAEHGLEAAARRLDSLLRGIAA